MAIQDQVMRHSNFDETKDFIPTPPFATRVLFEFVHPKLKKLNTGTIWDPACGAGHMCKVFEEYEFKDVWASDAYDWGYPNTKILDVKDATGKAEAIVTNPPYKLMPEFIRFGLKSSKECLALLARVQVLEGQRRYTDFYKDTPPTKIAIFSDRIPFKTGKVVRKAPKMFTHIWLVWDKTTEKREPPMWIPPNAQEMFEKEGDYDE